MKLSLKSSSLFAAVAMSIYSAFIIIAQTPLYDNVILSVDKYFVLSYVCTCQHVSTRHLNLYQSQTYSSIIQVTTLANKSYYCCFVFHAFLQHIQHRLSIYQWHALLLVAWFRMAALCDAFPCNCMVVAIRIYQT